MYLLVFLNNVAHQGKLYTIRVTNRSMIIYKRQKFLYSFLRHLILNFAYLFLHR